MYDLKGYGGMIANAARVDPYLSALREAIQPGDVVLDIGTGPGLFAMVACQLGAARVYAIEPSPIIALARRMAEANGFADRIRFIEGLSTQIALPERANVIVSDLRGRLPLFGTHIPSIIDARTRLLADGGTLIAQMDTVWVAVVDVEQYYDAHVDIWKRGLFGLDMTAANAAAEQTLGGADLTADQLCTTAGCWATLDYTTIREAGASGSADLLVTSDRTAHGIAMWFDTKLTDSVGFSNAPAATREGGARPLYRQMFFPWPARVALQAGQKVSVELRAIYVDEDYVWSWNTAVEDADGTIRVQFAQSSLAAQLISAEELKRSGHDSVPARTEGNEIDALILASINGQASLESIARLVAERYTDRFDGWRAALKRVAKVCEGASRG